MSSPFARIDPELVSWLQAMPRPRDTGVEATREVMRQITERVVPTPVPSTMTVADMAVPGRRSGPEVRIRVYTPERSGDLPGLLCLHGGGFVAGSIEDIEHTAVEIADEVGAVVVSVDYRLAPEHPFPAALEDCLLALEWFCDNAASLGVDVHRIGVLGQSAGATLAAGLALLARDRGGPRLCFQMLEVPALDNRPSSSDASAMPMLSRDGVARAWRHYLGDGTPVFDGGEAWAYAVPALAEDLSGLPPTYIGTCEFDPLRDDGLEYGLRLLRAGVPTEIHSFPGTFHGAALVRSSEVARKTRMLQRSALRRALHGGPTESESFGTDESPLEGVRR